MDFKILDPGLIDYQSAWELQQEVFQQVKDSRLEAAFLLCSHHPVITLGRMAKSENILAGRLRLRPGGINVYQTERGGDVTYHGPGQVMFYPIVNLHFFKKDLHWFLRALEGIAIACLSGYGIKARRRSGLTGVWVNDEKIASIGIAVRSWITFHGLSLNVKEDDLGGYSLIRPCGMDITMTSMESILGRQVNMLDVKERLKSALSPLGRGIGRGG